MLLHTTLSGLPLTLALRHPWLHDAARELFDAGPESREPAMHITLDVGPRRLPSTADAAIVASPSPGRFDLPGQFQLTLEGEQPLRAHATLDADGPLEGHGAIQNVLRIALLHTLAAQGGLLLHAAAVTDPPTALHQQGEALGAFVFFGKSGAGKSTLARAAGWDALLSDELACLRQGRVWRVPFTGERLPPRAALSAPLLGLFAITRGATLALTPLPLARAFERLMPCVVNVGYDAALSSALFRAAAAHTEATPCFALQVPDLTGPDAPRTYQTMADALRHAVKRT